MDLWGYYVWVWDLLLSCFLATVERVTNQLLTKRLDLDYCQSENYDLLFRGRSIAINSTTLLLYFK